ncbi:MAG: hypothetical protein K1X72_16010 [Pyrinomonadaceae bacterium]|nr:hypothetical protein [Pyrinomonadaceae bacterium]
MTPRKGTNIEDVTDEKDTVRTGSDLPNADGQLSDEGFHKISGEETERPTGQDHSTENYEETEPDSGVGAVQDSSDTNSDIAHFNE